MPKTITPIPERLALLPKLTVYSGNHKEPSNGEPAGCANELISWVAGLPWSDHPECTDSRLSDLIIAVNDGITDKEKRSEYMRKVIPLAINTASRKAAVTKMLKTLAIRRLKEECLSLAETWPESVRNEVVAAIEQTIRALDGRGDLESAAAAAESAAAAAAWSAAGSAAAEAMEREAQRLIEGLEALPSK